MMTRRSPLMRPSPQRTAPLITRRVAAVAAFALLLLAVLAHPTWAIRVLSAAEGSGGMQMQTTTSMTSTPQATGDTVQASGGPLLEAAKEWHNPTQAAAPTGPDVVIIPVPNPVPVPVPTQLAAAPAPVPSTPTVVGSGGIKVVTSNPISIENPIEINTPNTNGNKNAGGGGLSSLVGGAVGGALGSAIKLPPFLPFGKK
ncbi:hypothetical protein FOA52_003982 [Chlamydomonas sp. UWO 241]|nr:hypothetical protein FOA52_003982 [Chlamydomonas sp. UWO 241]